MSDKNYKLSDQTQDFDAYFEELAELRDQVLGVEGFEGVQLPEPPAEQPGLTEEDGTEGTAAEDTPWYLPDDDDEFISPEEEARRDEFGAQFGDPRRCQVHRDVATSSPDGMFDGPCWKCESLIDEAEDH